MSKYCTFNGRACNRMFLIHWSELQVSAEMVDRTWQQDVMCMWQVNWTVHLAQLGTNYRCHAAWSHPVDLWKNADTQQMLATIMHLSSQKCSRISLADQSTGQLAYVTAAVRTETQYKCLSVWPTNQTRQHTVYINPNLAYDAVLMVPTMKMENCHHQQRLQVWLRVIGVMHGAWLYVWVRVEARFRRITSQQCYLIVDIRFHLKHVLWSTPKTIQTLNVMLSTSETCEYTCRQSVLAHVTWAYFTILT